MGPTCFNRTSAILICTYWASRANRLSQGTRVHPLQGGPCLLSVLHGIHRMLAWTFAPSGWAFFQTGEGDKPPEPARQEHWSSSAAAQVMLPQTSQASTGRRHAMHAVDTHTSLCRLSCPCCCEGAGHCAQPCCPPSSCHAQLQYPNTHPQPIKTCTISSRYQPEPRLRCRPSCTP